MVQEQSDALLRLTLQIVSAYVAHNKIEAANFAALITTVQAALATAGAEPKPVEKQQPAVRIKRSVFPDYLICLEDGRKLKTLKRHLLTSFNMTLSDYRAKWNLPAEYPMVAPNYAALRSSIAKKTGPGRLIPSKPVVISPRASGLKRGHKPSKAHAAAE